MDKRVTAGLSLKGGRKDQFFFCLIEYFEDGNRSFLKSVLQVKDEESLDGNDAIRTWINKFEIKDLIVDFPLTKPPCLDCNLECPGVSLCPELKVIDVKNEISELITVDTKLRVENPKKYEQERNADDLVDFNKNILEKETSEHMLSRSFKRRLKKGFVPYWNRPLDLWVWCQYYDQLLDLFKISYDSFGNTSLMLMSRFEYLKRHFPNDLNLHEGNYYICLIELLRARIITKKDLIRMMELEGGAIARLDMIRKIEKKLNLFVYDKDLEVLSYNPRAFESFLLAIIGRQLHLGKIKKSPKWSHASDAHFMAPEF